MSTRERPVVARLATGLVIRGSTLEFNPERPSFRVSPDVGGRGVEVKVRDLKALFFPKLAPGADPTASSAAQYVRPTDPARDGKRIVIRFEDNEVMTGFTLSYRADRVGFYLFPDDPHSQHEKVFIVNRVVTEVITGDAAVNYPVAVRVPWPKAA